MTAILTVLEIVSPVFLLGAIGFFWVRLGHDFPLEFVTRLGMSLAVPCLIFVSLMKTEIDPAALATVSLASLVAYLLIIPAMWLLVYLSALDRRTFLAPVIFGNTGNLGLPLALFAFGEIGLGYAVVVFAVMALINFTFGIWLVSGGGSLIKVVQEPLVAATLLGGLFLWQGWETPRFLTNTLELIGQIGIPIMLITLGVAIARLRLRSFAKPTLLSILKFAMCAGCAVGIGFSFNLDKIAFGVLVLQVATPVAVTSYMLAEKYGADGDSVAALVVVSTLISVVTFPVLLIFLL